MSKEWGRICGRGPGRCQEEAVGGDPALENQEAGQVVGPSPC